jgi:hypothetical protein
MRDALRSINKKINYYLYFAKRAVRQCHARRVRASGWPSAAAGVMRELAAPEALRAAPSHAVERSKPISLSIRG